MQNGLVPWEAGWCTKGLGNRELPDIPMEDRDAHKDLSSGRESRRHSSCELYSY